MSLLGHIDVGFHVVLLAQVGGGLHPWLQLHLPLVVAAGGVVDDDDVLVPDVEDVENKDAEPVKMRFLCFVIWLFSM